MFLLAVALLVASSAPEPVAAHSPQSCDPGLCGPNSACNIEAGGHVTCRCADGFAGSSFPCAEKISYPACTFSTDCQSYEVCVKGLCRDSCYEACGSRAICSTSNHYPVCTCPQGFTGDPFVMCQSIDSDDVEQ